MRLNLGKLLQDALDRRESGLKLKGDITNIHGGGRDLAGEKCNRREPPPSPGKGEKLAGPLERRKEKEKKAGQTGHRNRSDFPSWGPVLSKKTDSPKASA